MTLRDLLAKYEATRDQMKQEGNPQAAMYDELVENTRRLIADFEAAAGRFRD